ncbi:MAG: hypothetical protein R2791_20320 [Saprospiraceae bacterium]
MKHLLGALLIAAVCHSAAAQLDTFQYRQNGVDISFQGVVAHSNAELDQIDLYDAMFPVVIVPRQVLRRAIEIGDRQSRLADSLYAANYSLLRQNDLNLLEIQKKDAVIASQKDFIAFSDHTNAMLNKSIEALNLQLSECRQVASDANKSQAGKKIWGILVGGGIGLGLGAILGVIATK